MNTPKANDKQVGGSHYQTVPLQHWDVVAIFALDYYQGNISKYLFRWRDKGGLEDLKKARHYLDKYIEIETMRKNGGLTYDVLTEALQRVEEFQAQAEQIASARAEALADAMEHDAQLRFPVPPLVDGYPASR